MLNGTSDGGSRPSSEDDDSKFNLPTFDAYNEGSWNFGDISREEATKILLKEHDDGIFLVRASKTDQGSFVLCVRESGRLLRSPKENDDSSLISNYLIQVSEDPTASMSDEKKLLYEIGGQVFHGLPELLNFYKLHYLDSTPLIRPAPRPSTRVKAKFDFAGQEDNDLSFKRGETLWVIQKDEMSHNSWWFAQNTLGQSGQIPSSYVEIDTESDSTRNRNSNNSLSDRNSAGSSNDSTACGEKSNAPQPALSQRKLPAFARVKQARIPNAYDKTALRLEKGDVVLVTKALGDGTLEGELKNKRRGHFPFTYVEWIDDPNG